MQVRKKDTLNSTLNWLNTHELVYVEVHLRACLKTQQSLITPIKDKITQIKAVKDFFNSLLKNDKSILFENSYAVIDDSPALLEKAEQLGKVGTGLVHPWNKESGHP